MRQRRRTRRMPAGLCRNASAISLSCSRGATLRDSAARVNGAVYVNDLLGIFSTRGDLAHLALFLWASSASALAWFALRELAAAMRRFDDFVRELARFNNRFGGKTDGHAPHHAARDPR
jgi:hypothetical protein